MLDWRRTLLLVLTLAMGGMFTVGCAQDVGDIDRTQPNYIKKTDLEGVWYYRQTVVDVPPTISYAFVGVASDMEKIRWEIQEDFLVAYRTYEKNPGQYLTAGDIENGEQQYEEGLGEGRSPDDFKEAPVAAFRIISHFDRQRAYNPTTGEQQNVIVENISDRPWYDRDFMRVDWSFNHVDSFWSLNSFQVVSNVSYYVQENEGGPDAFYAEDTAGDRLFLDTKDRDSTQKIGYFDFVNKMNMAPSGWGCGFVGGVLYGAGCEAGIVKMRNSFYKLPEVERDYEPALYDDQAMTKFGYFRTERLTYDRLKGWNDDGVIYLANRHDIWENDYQRDGSGEYVRDERGLRVPTPMAQRTPKPIVYYLSEGFPRGLVEGVSPDGMPRSVPLMEADWDRAYRRAVSAATGQPLEQVPQMFYICNNPVRDGDPAACGEPGFTARVGDLRHSFVFWVDAPQPSGPLGYGPSYPDPETGELVSGTAYVYGAAVDTYARSSLEIVRFLNGDYTEEQIRNGDDVREYVLENLNPAIDPRGSLRAASMEALSEIPLDQAGAHLLGPEKMAKIDAIREVGLDALGGDPLFRERQVERIKEHGFDRLLLDDETIIGLSEGRFNPADGLNADDINTLLSDHNPVDFYKRNRERQQFLDQAMKHNIYLAEFADDAVMATAERFKGRTDYDNVWNEIRNEIFRGVMSHEIGHTLGLRHNFQGSFDALNFFDPYWELRKENLPANVQSVADLYSQNAVTPNQAEGNMMTYQYSSIMDYHSRFNGDWRGIGKYDEAAIIFAYTSGTHDAGADQELGFVEVYTDLPADAADLIRAFDDQPSPAYGQMLEYIHYTNAIRQLGGGDVEAGIANNLKRALVPYGDIKARIEAGDDTREPMVPYMFCSDEWNGATFSCQLWDLGADPMEQVQWAVRNYRAYYPFTHFRRERFAWGVNNVLGRSLRAFMFMPNIYQHWYYNQFYGGYDQTLDNMFLFAALTGLNFLNDVVTAPPYGSFSYDTEEDEYYLVSYDPDYVPDEGSVDLRITPGVGRRNFSRFQFDTGYYYFTRTDEVGNFWDFYGAMAALTQSNFTTLGVDVQADFRSFSLPFFLAFDNELTTLFNGLIREDYADFAPLATSTGIERRPLTQFSDGRNNFNPETGEIYVGEGSPVNVRTSFTQRYYAILYGMAFFSSNFSMHYVDQGRVFKLGNGEQLAAGPGQEVITFTDPTTSITYGALRPQGGSTNPGLAEGMVLDGIDLAARAQSGDRNAQFELQQLVENINIAISLTSVFGTVF